MRVLVALAALLAIAMAEDAVLLTSKDFANNVAVANEELTVVYTIYNVGEGAAKDVTLVDESFKEAFTHVAGLTTAKFSSIPAGGKAVHTLVVTPLQPGYYNMTVAKVTYKANADAEEEQVSYSSNPGRVAVIPGDAYARAYNSHLVEWVIFIALAGAVVLFPFKVYTGFAEKYSTKAKSS